MTLISVRVRCRLERVKAGLLYLDMDEKGQDLLSLFENGTVSAVAKTMGFNSEISFQRTLETPSSAVARTCLVIAHYAGSISC